MLDLSKVTHEHFQACLNERFVIEVGPASPIELELVSVETRGSLTPATGRRAFSLLFRGPKTPLLEQRIWALRSDTLGALELFLVPVGPDDLGMLYEAAFT